MLHHLAFLLALGSQKALPLLAGIIPDVDSGKRLTQNRNVDFGTDTGQADSAINKLFGERILGPFTLLLGAIAVLLIIWAGIQYITAIGNAEAMKRARQSLFNIVLGIVLVVSAYTIIAIILNLLQNLANANHT